jgi:hypothetical protein
MIQKNMQRQLVEIVAVLMALGALNAAHAITQPIQTQRGVVRLGSKTLANVDANPFERGNGPGNGLGFLKSWRARQGYSQGEF